MVKNLCLIVIMIGFIPGCRKKHQLFVRQTSVSAEPLVTEIASYPPPVTIYVHGTKPLLPEWYLIKRGATFSPRPGLVKVTDIPEKYGAHIYPRAISRADSQSYPLHEFYVFGWSGKLDCKERLKAASELYKALCALSLDYHATYQKMPHVTIITHSHGGNVALNLPRVKDDIEPFPYVHRLIMLACPVQKETRNCIYSPMFKTIYSMYSTLDIFQILDPQGFHRTGQRVPRARRNSIFSGRRFPLRPQLRQVKLKLNERGIFHTEFTQIFFGAMLPRIIKEIDIWQHTSQVFDCSPFKKHLLKIRLLKKRRKQ